MSGILRTTKISCMDNEGKTKVLAAFQKLAGHVDANCPDVKQYIVALPLEDISGNDIYVIEEFEAEAGLESLQNSETVNAATFLLRDTSIVTSEPEVHIGSIAVKAVSGGPLILASNPAILLVGMEYKPGTVSNAVAGWKDMAEGAIESVSGVNVFTVMEDTSTSTIRTIEVLDSWESLSILVKTDAAKRNIDHNGKYRTGKKSAIKLQAVAGFVGRT